MKDQPDSNPKNKRLRYLSFVLVLTLVVWGAVVLYRFLQPPDHLLSARQAVEVGEFVTAAEHYENHLARYPEDWGARNELGLVAAQFDRPRALAEFRKVPADTEAYPDACRQIVDICLASERHKEAETVLVDFTERHPADAWGQSALAAHYFRTSRPQNALPHAQTAVDLSADEPGVHFLLAEIFDELRRPMEMVKPLETVIQLEHENYAAHLNLAYAYSEAGESEKSGREAKWCLARNPTDVFARRFLALAERDAGDMKQAMRTVQAALQVSPNDLDCRLLEAELLLYEKDATKALERLTPIYEAKPTDRRIVALLARAAATAGNKELAAEYREQVQKLSSP